MASRALHLKSQHQKRSQTLLRITTTKLTFSHLFSSSSSSDNNKENGGLSSCLSNIKSQLKQKSSERSDFPPEAQGSSTPNNGGNDYEKSYPFSGYLKDIQSKLKHHEEQRQRNLTGFLHSAVNPQGSPKASSLDNIRQNLSAFRSRSTDQLPESSSTQQPILSQNAGNPNSRLIREKQFMDIKESMRQIQGERNKSLSKPTLLNSFRNSSITQETMSESGGFPKMVIGGSDKDLPMKVFGKEMKEKETRQGKGEYGAKKEVWMKSYPYDALGEKLRMLKPAVKGGEDNWISELNDRLQKIKEIEQQELTAVSDPAIMHLRQSISVLQEGKDNSKTAHIIGLDTLGSPSFMLYPPKEHLVEKYFHPDNMSAEDKMKLELKKVRDEFKMHESDCGSARVQIAQLTTEILHLSSVLHKKDKHSRRGLQAKVQQRKKLLKYLRRTDWESYCFVLSKLGLRDNPDYKN